LARGWGPDEGNPQRNGPGAGGRAPARARSTEISPFGLDNLHGIPELVKAGETSGC